VFGRSVITGNLLGRAELTRHGRRSCQPAAQADGHCLRFELASLELIGCVLLAVWSLPRAARAQTATFDTLSMAPSSAWAPAAGNDSFVSGGITFGNQNSSGGGYTYWSGWTYSNMTDAMTPGFGNQYSAITGRGANGSANYAIGYPGFDGNLTITLPAETTVLGAYLTNTAYAYWSMYSGDQFARAFTSSDRFTLTISASDAKNQPVGTPLDFNLAQGRNIINRWTWVDLSSLGSNVKTLSFDLFTTDYGIFGPNSPTYLAMDTFGVAAVGPVLHWSGSGAGSSWRSSASWDGETLDGSQALSFAGSPGLAAANDLPADTQVCGLQFESGAGGFALSGNRLSLAGNISNASTLAQTIGCDLRSVSDVTIVDALAGDLAITGNITGGVQLLKGGLQTLVLSGTNDYSGGTVVAEGELEIRDPVSIPSGSALTVGDGGPWASGTSSTAGLGIVPVGPAAVPEPSSILLLVAGGTSLLSLRRAWRRGKPCL
jgi:autotransporter-associated beta strand protein